MPKVLHQPEADTRGECALTIFSPEKECFEDKFTNLRKDVARCPQLRLFPNSRMVAIDHIDKLLNSKSSYKHS